MVGLMNSSDSGRVCNNCGKEIGYVIYRAHQPDTFWCERCAALLGSPDTVLHQKLDKIISLLESIGDDTTYVKGAEARADLVRWLERKR